MTTDQITHRETDFEQPIKVVSWNIARRPACIDKLLEMGADLALLQEASVNTWKDLQRVSDPIQVSPHEPWLPWQERHYDRWPLIVGLSDRVRIDWLVNRVPQAWPNDNEFPASGIGIAAAARVAPTSGADAFTAVSMYARWVESHRGQRSRGGQYSDVSAHRILSDISTLLPSRDPSGLRILAAGDLNMTFDAVSGDFPHTEFVRKRFRLLGFEYLGPQYPDGRRYSEKSTNVLTFRTGTPDRPGTQTQVDYVFATSGFHRNVKTRALNTVEEWGPSDHCRILIEVAA